MCYIWNSMTIRRFGQIGGHIPGAVNVPWSEMVNEMGLSSQQMN